MKKIISILLTAALMLLMATAVFARGHCNNVNSAPKNPVCAVESCTVKGSHIHDAETYCAHYYGDGHDYHDYCAVEDCVAAGYHEHDGVYCFGITSGGGGYRNMGNCLR